MRYKKTNILRLANTVFKKIQKEKLLNSQDHLLITFSGGQDSALCLLILFILKKRTNFVQKQKLCKNFVFAMQARAFACNAWNPRKIVDFSKPYQTQGALIKQMQKPNCYRSSLCYAKTKLLECKRTNCTFVGTRCNEFDLVCARFLKRSLLLLSSFHSFSKVDATCLTLTPTNSFKKRDTKDLGFSEKKIAYNHLYKIPVTNYTLLWCNHFWQRQAFSTMKHVSKLVFCKGYAIHFFAPVRTVLSEQGARNWRHKVMQRSSLFLAPKECGYNSIELCYNLVSVCHTRSATKDKKAHAKELVMRASQSGCIAKTKFLQGVQKRSFCLQARQSKHSLVDIACLQSSVPNVSQHFCTHNLSAENELSFLPQVKKSQEPNHWDLRGYALNTQSLPEQLCVQGHTKSDRAETILFNVIKGAGMNGLSTLQCKHTVYSDPHFNTMFYPISSDFFKEIRIVSLQSQNGLKKKTVSTNRLSLPLFANKSLCKNEVFATAFVRKQKLVQKLLLLQAQRSFVLLRFLNTVQFGYRSVNPKTRRDSNQSESNMFCKDSHIKTFYYQLKYKTRKI